MNLLDVIAAAVLGILLYSSQLSNFAPERNITSSSAATSVLTQVAQKIDTICENSQGQCLDNGTALTTTTALTTLANYLPVVPNDPMSQKPLSLNVAADANDANIKHWSLDAAGKYNGADLGNTMVYSGGAESAPVAGTFYYLHYDPCIGQVFATTSATSTPIQCT